MVRDLVGASLLSGEETLPVFSVFSAATGSGLAGRDRYIWNGCRHGA